MAIQVKVTDAEVSGDKSEVIEFLRAMDYGPKPLRAIFPITPEMRGIAPLTIEREPVGAENERAKIEAYLRDHPNARPVEVVRAVGGAHLRSSGGTRALYNRLFQRVNVVLRDRRARTAIAAGGNSPGGF